MARLNSSETKGCLMYPGKNASEKFEEDPLRACVRAAKVVRQRTVHLHRIEEINTAGVCIGGDGGVKHYPHHTHDVSTPEDEVGQSCTTILASGAEATSSVSSGVPSPNSSRSGTAPSYHANGNAPIPVSLGSTGGASVIGAAEASINPRAPAPEIIETMGNSAF